MINRILFFVENPWEERDHTRFGVELLERNGFEVAVYDVTPVFYPVVAAEYQGVNPLRHDRIRSFTTREEILTAIAGLGQETFVFFCLGATPEKFFLYQAFSRHKIRYGFLTTNALPGAEPNSRRGTRILEKLRQPLMLFDIVRRRTRNYCQQAYFRLEGDRFHGAELWVGGGSESLGYYPFPRGKNTETLWGHAFDYDLFLEHRRSNEKKSRQAVFLDAYLPFHPEYMYENSSSPVMADQYYPQLVSVFEALEEAIGLEVVIAAHPRAEYGKHPDFFKGRSVVQGKTVELVRDAQAVLLHSSTALNFAVLFRKPMIFLTINGSAGNSMDAYAQALSSWFGKNPVDIGQSLDLVDWKAEMMVDEERYQAYQDAFIKRTGSPELPLWQIIADRLKEMS